jgi:hypothetical protein
MNAYEKTLRLAVELLEDMHANMSYMSFKAFEADIYAAIGETYNEEISQVREDAADLDWMTSGTED